MMVERKVNLQPGVSLKVTLRGGKGVNHRQLTRTSAKVREERRTRVKKIQQVTQLDEEWIFRSST